MEVLANAIAQRYDAGIVKHSHEHTGVIEIYKVTEIEDARK